ncbi:methyltransferase domain-containing protein [Aquicoccus sp. SCR17]|nr:methyltransferase domain-containing protein [Carideicomes alvinocaridis]
MDIDAVTTSYARWAPVYDRTFGAITNAGRRRAGAYVSAFDAPDVLEVGVGTGLALPHYGRHCRVTGVDFSDEMLEKARERVREEKLGHVRDLLQMDARHLDFPDDSFDVVVCMHVISVVPEPRRVMAEIARVLKPGGRAVITSHFARETGVLARLERWAAPFANTLGWHSDFDRAEVTETPGLRLVEESSLPPMGMMTFMVLEKGQPLR